MAQMSRASTESAAGEKAGRDKLRLLIPSAALFSIIVASAVIRFVKLHHESLFSDELYNVWASHKPLGSLVPEVIAGGHLSLYNIVMHFWHLPNGSELWARSISASFGVIAVALVYFIGREPFSRRTGLWAAALAAVCPLMVWYSRSATSYSWVMVFSLLSFYFLVRSSLKGGWRNWTAYILSTVVVILSSFLAPVMLVGGWAVYWIIRNPEKSGIRFWAASQLVLLSALGLFTMASRSLFSGRTRLVFPSLISVIRRNILNRRVAAVTAYVFISWSQELSS